MTGHQSLDVLIGMIVAVLLALLLAVAAFAMRRPKDKTLELEAAYRRFSPTAVVPGRNRSQWLKRLVLAVLIMLNVVWLGFLLSRALGDRAVDTATPSVTTQSATPGGLTSSAGSPAASDRGSRSSEDRTIQLVDVIQSAGPFEAVRVQGTYRGGAETFLQVQRWEGGKWVAFPVPTKTDEVGYFSTYIELGRPGRYPVRVVDPDSGVRSKTFVLMIQG
jgi:hypothetical protein